MLLREYLLKYKYTSFFIENKVKQKYHTVGTGPKSNRKFVEEANISLKHIYIAMFTLLAWHRRFNKKWRVKKLYNECLRDNHMLSVPISATVVSSIFVSAVLYWIELYVITFGSDIPEVDVFMVCSTVK